MKRPTLNDVAAEAGVSGKSVSRVINGASNISPELRRRVEAAVEKLNYVPNTLARTLKVGTGDTVGVVIDTISDPFFAALTSAVEAAALEAGLGTVFGSTGFDPERERQQVERMAMQQVRGADPGPGPALARLPAPLRRRLAHRAGRPGGRGGWLRHRAGRRPGRGPDRGRAPAAARAPADRLRRRTTRPSPPPATGCAGYRDALAAHGIDDPGRAAPPDPGDRGRRGAGAGRLLALPDPPTAVFAANPRAGSRMAHALHAGDHADLAFVSFGDFPLSQSLRPPVTYVDHDPRAIGRAAMRRVLERLGGERGPPRDVFVRDGAGAARFGRDQEDRGDDDETGAAERPT